MALALPIGMTLEEWGALPEDHSGELIDGILVEEEEPDLTHEMVIGYLYRVLFAYFSARGGIVVGSGLKLGVSPRRGRLGDVVCFGADKRPPSRGVVRVPPDIIVEVISSSPSDERRDRIHKPDDYAAFGVGYYWLVDPAFRTFEILELGGDGRYVRALAATSGVLETVPGCAALVVDLDALWAEVDALPASDDTA